MADQRRSSRRGLDYEPNETPSRMASVDDFLDSVDDALLRRPSPSIAMRRAATSSELLEISTACRHQLAIEK